MSLPQREPRLGRAGVHQQHLLLAARRLSLWEASLELRFPVLGPLSASVFCDASDVSADQLDIRIGYPHLSCGPGVRYDTPIGPVRIDIGFRIPGAQIAKDADKTLEGDPGTIFGVPAALSFGIGEAF